MILGLVSTSFGRDAPAAAPRRSRGSMAAAGRDGISPDPPQVLWGGPPLVLMTGSLLDFSRRKKCLNEKKNYSWGESSREVNQPLGEFAAKTLFVSGVSDPSETTPDGTEQDMNHREQAPSRLCMAQAAPAAAALALASG